METTKILEEKCGDFLTPFNHNSVGNPHVQYVSNNETLGLRPYDILNGNYFKVLTVLLDDKRIDKNVNGQFEIAFDVYDSYDDGVDNDDKWELFLKVGNIANTETKQTDYSISVKLKGQERRCIATVDKITIKEDEEITDKDNNHYIETRNIEKIRVELYIKLTDNIRLIKTFLNTNINSKYYTIYNRTHSIPKLQLDEKLTKEEIEFYKDKLNWIDDFLNKRKQEIENKKILLANDKKKLDEELGWYYNDVNFYSKERDFCNNMIELSKDEKNLIESKIFSRTENNVIYYNSSKSNDGYRYLKLFDLDNRYSNQQSVDYVGIFELYTTYGLEFKGKENYENKYIKFAVSCNNGANDYDFSMSIIDSLNIHEDTLFATIKNGIISIWLNDLYPSKVRLKPIMNDDESYQVFKINDIDNEFVKFLPSNSKKL